MVSSATSKKPCSSMFFNMFKIARLQRRSEILSVETLFILDVTLQPVPKQSPIYLVGEPRNNLYERDARKD